MSTISGTITTTVTIGTSTGDYASPLSIYADGTIIPSIADAYAIFAPSTYGGVVTIVNQGLIAGGAGASSDGGGIAVYLAAVGTVINDGTIIGGAGGSSQNGTGDTGGTGVEIYASGNVTNNGTVIGGTGGTAQYGIAGTGGGGIILVAGGTVTNSGVIIGGAGGSSPHGTPGAGGAGIQFNNGPGDVTNNGTVTGGTGGTTQYTNGGTGGAGILLLDGGTVTNSGVITGGAGGYSTKTGGSGGYGLGFFARGTVTNSGVITGGAGGYGAEDGGAGGFGLVLFAGGTVANSGVITGGAGGEGGGGFYYGGGGGVGVVLAGATLTNDGTITGGVGGEGGGDGGTGGIGDYMNGGLLINDGTITGGAGGEGSVGGTGGVGVYLYGGGLLINAGTISGGAAGTGTGADGTAGDAVKFGGATAGTLEVLAGAVFDGDIVANASVADVLLLGSSTSAGYLAGIGTQFTNFQTIAFASDASWDIAGTYTGFAGTNLVAGFAAGDTIELDGFTATSSLVLDNELELFNADTTITLNIHGLSAGETVLVNDDAAGTEITICYLKGTRILTAQGERAIESLQRGDLVVTRWGGLQPVKWIGRQSFGRHFLKGRLPVRIAAGALGDGLPLRDLFVSPGHSMLIGETLVLAENLCNGVTITRDGAPEEIHYYQLEFAAHDCVLAEGVWSESYADAAGLRAAFHNHAEFAALFPDEAAPPAEPILCAPRPRGGPVLAAALRPSVARAAALAKCGPLLGYIDSIGESVQGWALDAAYPHLPVLLEILLDGAPIGEVLACEPRPDVAQAGFGAGWSGFAFTLPEDARLQGQELQVRRQADGAAISMTLDCQLSAA
jgi:hypothetical protein